MRIQIKYPLMMKIIYLNINPNYKEKRVKLLKIKKVFLKSNNKIMNIRVNYYYFIFFYNIIT